ncbi:MAG TPA: biotin/lipoyl-binding protein [Mycobacteriales bacterium]|nr:biotin/lipoyl-binding protein [Mycobacteriales bacterium]
MAVRVRALARRPKVVVPLALVLVVAAGTGAWAATRGSDSSGFTTTTTLADVTTGTITQSVTATATLTPQTTSDLSFTAAGTVTAVNVAEGSKVSKGQVLATMDSAALQSTVAQANSTLVSAQSRLSSDTSAGASSAQLDADSAAVTAAQTQLASAQAALAGATLTAPIDGTVSGVDIAVGDQIGGGGSGSPSSGSGSGSSVASGQDSGSSSYDIEVVSTGSYVATASFDDTEVGQIKVGDQATLTPTGTAAGSNIFGTVASVSNVASSDSTTSSYPVVVNVTGSPTGLHSGQTVSMVITTKQLTDVTLVPTAAIGRDTDGSSYVTVRNGGKDVKTTVTTGAASGAQTQVVKGVSAGDKVVVTTIRRSGGNLPDLRRNGSGGGGLVQRGEGGFGGAPQRFTGGSSGFGGGR